MATMIVARRSRVQNGQPVSVPIFPLLRRMLTQAIHVRYCIQAAAIEGLATYPNAKDRFADVIHHRIALRPNRRITDMGEQQGAQHHRLLNAVR